MADGNGNARNKENSAAGVKRERDFSTKSTKSQSKIPMFNDYVRDIEGSQGCKLVDGRNRPCLISSFVDEDDEVDGVELAAAFGNVYKELKSKSDTELEAFHINVMSRCISGSIEGRNSFEYVVCCSLTKVTFNVCVIIMIECKQVYASRIAKAINIFLLLSFN